MKCKINEKSNSCQARDAFILVLIDGDGMIFDDRLIKNGEAGGREAAGLLWNAVMECFENDTGVPSDVKIVTRIYANLKGLGDVCKKSGIISTSSNIEDFARGFTGSKQLFDFVDVGVGKANFWATFRQVQKPFASVVLSNGYIARYPCPKTMLSQASYR